MMAMNIFFILKSALLDFMGLIVQLTADIQAMVNYVSKCATVLKNFATILKDV